MDSMINSIVTWLIAGAPPPRSINEFIAEYANRLVRAGIPIASLAFYSKHIHPMFPGNEVLWSLKRGVRCRTYPHAHLSDAYLKTPFAHSIENAQRLRLSLLSDPAGSEADLVRVYRNAGFKDLIILPLFDDDGFVNKCIGYGTKVEEGFSESQIRQLRRLQAPLARICQHFSDRSNIRVSLGTYLGRSIGERILEGQIQRGEGETISAVLLFVDLAGFTEHSNVLPGEEVVKRLNIFFNIISSVVEANNGEILKFIGDGALVVFPVPDDLTAQEAAAEGALRSVQTAREQLSTKIIRPAIKFRAALHIGDVFYGNIGSASRLDFTAVGPAVNLASRILNESSGLGADTVCSADFYDISRLQDCSSVALQLKGFEKPVSIVTIDSDDRS